MIDDSFRVVMVRLRARGPVQNDVRRGHQFDFHHAGVERMFARIKRRDPNAFMAGIDQIAMLEFEAADVLVRFADE